MASEEKLWSRDFAMAIVSRGLSSVVFMLLSTTLATYVVDRYSAGADVAGVVVGVFIIACMFSRVVAGRYADVWGRRRTLLVSGFAFSVLSACYLLPLSIGQLIALRVVHGFAFGICSNVINVVATGYIPPARLGEGLGYLSLSTPVSSAIGPFVGLALIQTGDYGPMFAVGSVMAFAGFVLSVPLRIRDVEMPERPSSARRMRLGDFFEASAVPISLVVGLESICIASVNSFVNEYASAAALGYVAPWFFVLNAAVMGFARPLLGKLQDAKGDNAVMLPAIIALGAGMLVLALRPSVATLLLASVVIAYGNGGVFPCGQAIAVRGVPEHRVSVATSTLYVVSDVGLGLGPVVGGVIVGFAGYSGMYLFSAFVTVVMLAFYWVVRGRVDVRRRSA